MNRASSRTTGISTIIATLFICFTAIDAQAGFRTRVPVNLFYVADYARMADMQKEAKNFYAATETNFIGQNVYLYCASAGLTTVVRSAVDQDTLAKAMELRPDQHVILAQTLGYPAK